MRHCRLILLLVLTAMVCPAIHALAQDGGPRIVVTGLQSIGREEFMEMLGLEGVRQVDAAMVRKAIKTAFLKGIFEEISVTVDEGLPQTVSVAVRERDFIRKIHISGDYALSKKRIRQLFIFKEDDQMRYDLLDQAASALKTSLSGLGFPEAKVSVSTRPAGKPYQADVILDVSTGQPRLIESIVFSVSVQEPEAASEPAAGKGANADAGQDEASDPDLKDLFGVQAGDIANRERIGQEIQKMRERLKRLGYIRPVAGPFSLVNGELAVQVSLGKKLVMVFDGNGEIETKDLMRESLLPESEDLTDETVGEAVDRMLMLYHSRGFPYAQIAPVMRSGDREIRLSFFIFEGQRVKVRSVNFTGTRLSADTLKQVMALKENGYYNPDQTEKDQELLREFLGALGYLEAAVGKIEVKYSEDRTGVDLTVDVEEGLKTVISAVEITGSSPENAESLKAVTGIKPGDPYNEVDISDARFRIIEFYRGRGYAAVEVAVRRKMEGQSAALVFEVSEGGKLYLGRTVVIGNRQTRYQVIKRELLHKEGQEFNLGLFAEERQRLYKLGLFTDVQIEAVDYEGDRRDVLVKLQEGNAGSVEFGIGYAEYEGFRGFFEVSYRNLWGMNREALGRAEVSSLEQRYLLQYNEPWAFGRRLPLKALFLYDKRREITASAKDTLYRLTRYSFSAGVEKRLSPVMKSDFYYEFSLVRTTDVRPDVVLTKEDTGTLAISSLKPALIYDTRDNPFEPQKGVLAGASLKFASALLLSETDFLKLEVYGSRFHKLSKDIVLALSARGGIAYHFGDTQELPLVERFFLGGRSNVRGYDQDTLGPKGVDGNPTGGNVFVMANIEFRTDVGRGIGVVPFIDLGNVWVNTKTIDLSDLRYTAGVGLRYKTPVGPLRVDYGFKLNKDPGESNGALHFSVGHAF